MPEVLIWPQVPQGWRPDVVRTDNMRDLRGSVYVKGGIRDVYWKAVPLIKGGKQAYIGLKTSYEKAKSRNMPS